MQDYLKVDGITVPGQLYALVSFVGPQCAQKNEQMGMKIRGTFPTMDEARGHAQRLMADDGSVHIYVVDMYKWMLIPPDANQIQDQVYQEEFLNNMMQEYQKNQTEAKRFFEERKNAVMQEGLDKHLLPEERLPPPPPESLAGVPDLAAMNDPHPSTSASASN
jgi:hypothetical protein